jgi:hypothetical protein
MDQPEDPYVIAAMLTYLYTLDYVDEGPQMSFGLPSDPNAKWLGDIGVEETMLPEYSEDDESPLIEWEELKSESEFNFAPDAELVVNTIDNNFEGAMDKDNEWESMSKSSTARKTPSPCHCSNTKRVSSSVSIDRDTGKPITPLALHVQMYTAGVRFGIPCLVSHALRKLENRICQNNFDDEELIEAASHAWRDLDEGQNINIEYNGSISIVRTSVLASMKARWQSVRVRDGFEELVLRRPGFGRDVLRIV